MNNASIEVFVFCWIFAGPPKRGETATSVFCLIGLLERCADEVVRKGFGDSGPQCGSSSPYENANE
eukprot:scaffold27225_cov80-Skeletonema_dohrnii-CCMP3373.AAC.5